MGGLFSTMQRQIMRNEAAKAARRYVLLDRRKKLTYPKGYSNIKEFNFPKVSKKELKYIKEAIRSDIKKDKIRNTIFLIILSISALIVVLNYVDFSIPKEAHVNEIQENNYLSENINEYSFLLDDGDQWIEKGNWNNAVYRYEQAVRLFPHKYEANYRLALAYSYHCQFKNKNCNLGEKLTDKLLKYHPDEINLIKLKAAFQDYTRDTLTTNTN